MINDTFNNTFIKLNDTKIDNELDSFEIGTLTAFDAACNSINTTSRKRKCMEDVIINKSVDLLTNLLTDKSINNQDIDLSIDYSNYEFMIDFNLIDIYYETKEYQLDQEYNELVARYNYLTSIFKHDISNKTKLCYIEEMNKKCRLFSEVLDSYTTPN